MRKKIKEMLEAKINQILDTRNLCDDKTMPIRVVIKADDGQMTEEMTITPVAPARDVITKLAYVLRAQVAFVFFEAWLGNTDVDEALVGAAVYPSGKADLMVVPIVKDGSRLISYDMEHVEYRKMDISKMGSGFRGWENNQILYISHGYKGA